MAYVFDIAVILILLITILVGYRRGFVKSILKLVGCIIAAILAGTFSLMAAQSVFDHMIAPTIEATIEKQISDIDTADIGTEIQNAMDSLPDVVQDMLSVYGVDSADQIVKYIDQLANKSISEVTHAVTANVIRPAIIPGLRMLFYIIIFILLSVLINVLSNFISRFFRLPVIRQFDGLLGSVIGAIEGVVWVLLIVTVIQLFATYSTEKSWIKQEDVEKSILVSRIAEVNPVTKMVEKLIDEVSAS